MDIFSFLRFFRNDKSDRLSSEFLKTDFRKFKCGGFSNTDGHAIPWGIFDYDFSSSLSNYNIGDGIQSLAVRRLKNILAPDSEEIVLNREKISLCYSKKSFLLVMQGYFSHAEYFLPDYPINPVFIGTHFNPVAQSFLKRFAIENPEYFKKVDVGCRDLSTYNFCKKIGLSAYFSRCLTLTFPRRKSIPKNGDVFIVDIPFSYRRYIPLKIRKRAVIYRQRAVPFSKFSTAESRLRISRETLRMYENRASLVITGALHCAAPCVAMGIPVVFIGFAEDCERFSALKDIIPIYAKDELACGKIDFENVRAPDIESLKILMIENLKLSIAQSLGCLSDVDFTRLSEIRSKIALYKPFEFVG